MALPRSCRWLFLLVLAAACSKSPDAQQRGSDQATPTPGSDHAAPPPRPAASGWYRAVVGEKQGTAIPFFLQITSGEAVIATGPDRVRAKLVSGPPKVLVTFDVLNTKIEAAARPDGVLEGTFSSSSKSWGAGSLSFRAEPIASPDPALRFPSKAAGSDPSGTWRVTLPKDDDHAKLVVARAANGEVTATLTFQTGNRAFLAGNQDGRTVRVSAFDGASPYLLVFELDETGKKLSGSWTAGHQLAWQEKLVGERAEFELEHQTKVAGDHPRLTVPQLAKPPYKGNPVIVELGGSWCPACGHASAKLRELATKYAKDGLKIVMLAYEFTDDPEYNKRQAALFKAKHDIPWEVIAIDGGLDKYHEILPKQLESIDASGFPITIFVGRDGRIEGFHSGFPPKSWGAPHEHTIAEYDRLAAKITAKP